ncbi:hypothetical protein ACP4OV_016406 [Aristida adscensionis]
MDRRSAAPPRRRCADDSELDVFAAERYFSGDDALCGGGGGGGYSSPSSSLSSAFRTGAHERGRSVPTPAAATSSSEASGNSRSALLRDAGALAVAVPDDVEGRPSASEIAGEHGGGGGRKPAPSSHSLLRRWLLGVAGCGCAGGDGEESVSADDDEYGGEVDADNDNVPSVAGQPSPRTDGEELTVEDGTTVSVKPGRWLDGGDVHLAGAAAFHAVQFPGRGHRRGANSFELSSTILNPATTPTADELRRKSLQMFYPAAADQGRAFQPANQSSASAFTIVAGTMATAAPGRPCSISGCDSGEDDGAAPSELQCAYPPSEASVAWSVVTAEGAASGNFSSAASGYYNYYFNDGERGVSRHAAAKDNRRRRLGITNSTGGLLTCMSKMAANAVGPARSAHRTGVGPAAVATTGTASGGRSGPGGGYPI